MKCKLLSRHFRVLVVQEETSYYELPAFFACSRKNGASEKAGTAEYEASELQFPLNRHLHDEYDFQPKIRGGALIVEKKA